MLIVYYVDRSTTRDIVARALEITLEAGLAAKEDQPE